MMGLKFFLKKFGFINYINSKEKKLLNNYYINKYSDKEYIEKLYRKANFGRNINWRNPKYFTEKLQWLKLFYRDIDIPICSDKVEVKSYITKLGYSDIIIPTINVYNNVDDIDFNHLPNRFIMKASHGSGWNIICQDKDLFNIYQTKKMFESWLSQNLYIYGREWNYQQQTPKILIEPLIQEVEDSVIDYKFMCFNGTPKYLQVNHDKDKTHYVDFYTKDWKKIDKMTTGVAKISDIVLPKPICFSKMMSIAKDLSKGFPFVRVDLYNVKNKIYFGEMTFFPGSGFWTLKPDEMNMKLGCELELPKPNYNLELFNKL